MRIEILDEAELDLADGFHFYEGQEAGLGWYFLDSLFSDVDSLQIYAGIHEKIYGYFRCLAKRFPFAVYYSVEEEIIRVHAVLDCRRKPSRIRENLTKRGQQ